MSSQWYYNLDGAHYGPVDEEEIASSIETGKIPPGVPVCLRGALDWQPARNHACFQVEVFPQRPRPESSPAPAEPEAAVDEPPVIEDPLVIAGYPAAGTGQFAGVAPDPRGYRDSTSLTKTVKTLLVLGIILSFISVLSSSSL